MFRIGKDAIVELYEATKSTAHARLAGHGALLWKGAAYDANGLKIGHPLTTVHIDNIGGVLDGFTYG